MENILTVEEVRKNYSEYEDIRILTEKEFNEELLYCNFSEDKDDYSVIITSDNVVLACRFDD